MEYKTVHLNPGDKATVHSLDFAEIYEVSNIDDAVFAAENGREIGQATRKGNCIYTLAVEPSSQDKHIGSELLRQIEDIISSDTYVKDEKTYYYDDILLAADKDSEKFFSKNGYEPVTDYIESNDGIFRRTMMKRIER